MRYKVTIPPPSAKRMAGSGKVLVRYHHGWDGDALVTYEGIDQDVHLLESGAHEFEFDVPDKYEWIGSTAIIDGWSFSVKAEYSNSTGSRKESYTLVPETIRK